MSKINVLIAEDDYFSSLLIKEFLKPYDINLFFAKNGEDAVKLCDNNKIDILITDISMPKINGVDLMKKIRKNNPEIKVIAETAYGTKEKLDEIKKAGFDAVIIKPYKKEDFQNTFQNIQKVLKAIKNKNSYSIFI